MPFDPPGAHASATFDVPPQPGEGQCSTVRLSPDSDPGDGGGLTGALADDEVVVRGNFRRGRIVAGQAVEEQLYGVLGDLGLVRADRGEAGSAVAPVLDIVEADQGDVLGNAKSAAEAGP